MFGFLIKKTFFDLWDNLYSVVIINFGYYVILAGIIGIIFGASFLLPLLVFAQSAIIGFVASLVVITLSVALFSVFSGAVACLVRDMADYQKATFGNFFKYLRETWKPSLIFGIIQGVLIGLMANAAVFYTTSMENLINPFIFFMLLWTYMVWLLASQYFFALQSRFDKKVRKNIRKMFILFFDNTAFTLFGLALLTVLSMTISVFLFLLFPGFTGILLLHSAAFKLRLLKYEYLEAHPEANRKKIPWDSLLVEERERVGKRTLKNMIFPWKD